MWKDKLSHGDHYCHSRMPLLWVWKIVFSDWSLLDAWLRGESLTLVACREPCTDSKRIWERLSGDRALIRQLSCLKCFLVRFVREGKPGSLGLHFYFILLLHLVKLTLLGDCWPGQFPFWYRLKPSVTVQSMSWQASDDLRAWRLSFLASWLCTKPSWWKYRLSSCM